MLGAFHAQEGPLGLSHNAMELVMKKRAPAPAFLGDKWLIINVGPARY